MNVGFPLLFYRINYCLYEQCFIFVRYCSTVFSCFLLIKELLYVLMVSSEQWECVWEIFALKLVNILRCWFLLSKGGSKNYFPLTVKWFFKHEDQWTWSQHHCIYVWSFWNSFLFYCNPFGPQNEFLHCLDVIFSFCSAKSFTVL